MCGVTALGPAILDRIDSAAERVWLVSPYVTSEALVEPLRGCTAPSKRLLTRYNIPDVLADATDLRVVAALMNAGVEVRVLVDVHAKIYVLDDWAYVGSANLTTRGLGASFREFGNASAGVGHAQEAIGYFESVWREATVLPVHVLKAASRILEPMRRRLTAKHTQQCQAAQHLLATVDFTPPRCAERRSGRKRSAPRTQIASQRSPNVRVGKGVLEFHDAEPGSDHNRFMRWRRQHKDGFYLAIKTKKKANLHRASCFHQGNYDFGEFAGSATKDRKLCATTPAPLHEWAREQAVAIHRCPHC